MTSMALETMDTPKGPFLVAAVKDEQLDWARRCAVEMARKHQHADVHPNFYLIWDPAVLSQERCDKLVAALGDAVRRKGGVSVMRLSMSSAGLDA